MILSNDSRSRSWNLSTSLQVVKVVAYQNVYKIVAFSAAVRSILLICAMDIIKRFSPTESDRPTLSSPLLSAPARPRALPH